MESFISVTGIAAPMMQINIDTDQIIPTRYLGGTDAKGYGAHLFANARFITEGQPNPSFILNQSPFDQAQILLSDRNFGCGSSRERAPKALREFGFRSMIAPSFGGIFFNNCFRNGLLPVVLPIEQIVEMVDVVEKSKGAIHVTVDLQSQTVVCNDVTYSFSAPATLREMLMQGKDEIDQTLLRGTQIDAWRASDRAKRPWAYTKAI
ncbi:MAG: 3-isopropylmalate dehydratase small subunit [Limnohabitans sp.]|nr:3-isopropylmalate dehydratase small subunit [Limnohabitans sp.]